MLWKPVSEVCSTGQTFSQMVLAKQKKKIGVYPLSSESGKSDTFLCVVLELALGFESDCWDEDENFLCGRQKISS